jgi:hypothetical protein
MLFLNGVFHQTYMSSEIPVNKIARFPIASPAVVLPLIFFFPQILNYIQVWHLFCCRWQMTFKEKDFKSSQIMRVGDLQSLR